MQNDQEIDYDVEFLSKWLTENPRSHVQSILGSCFGFPAQANQSCPSGVGEFLLYLYGKDEALAGHHKLLY